MKSLAERPLKGIITPLVTPLLDNDTLDRKGLETLIEHVLTGGVHGIFILGSTGEATSLTYRLRRELVQAACACINGRVPILVGVTDTSFSGSLEVARAGAEAGADAVVVAPPYYSAPGQSDLLAYFARLVAELPLPCFLYNIPSCTKVAIGIETAVAAADLPGVIGLKDSSGDMNYFNRLLHCFRDRPDFSLLMGPEELLAQSVLAGGSGGVNGGSNFAPRLYVDLYEATLAGDLKRVGELHKIVMKISMNVYPADKASGYYLKGVKSALSLMGICSDVMAEPFTSLDAEGAAHVERTLAEVGLLSPVFDSR
jgi:4-hydroxy-tetrahydrodipicolinate synthase